MPQSSIPRWFLAGIRQDHSFFRRPKNKTKDGNTASRICAGDAYRGSTVYIRRIAHSCTARVLLSSPTPPGTSTRQPEDTLPLSLSRLENANERSTSLDERTNGGRLEMRFLKELVLEEVHGTPTVRATRDLPGTWL